MTFIFNKESLLYMRFVRERKKCLIGSMQVNRITVFLSISCPQDKIGSGRSAIQSVARRPLVSETTNKCFFYFAKIP